MTTGRTGLFAGGPRVRLLTVCITLLFGLAHAACARFVDVHETDRLKQAHLRRIAIVPFASDLYVAKSAEPGSLTLVCQLEGKQFGYGKVPASAAQEVTTIFTHQLSIKGGYDLVLPQEVMALVRRRQLDPAELGPRAFFGAIAEGLGVDGVVAGNVYRYDELYGSAYGAAETASITIDVHLMDGKSGELLWEADYSESQAPLTDSAGSLGMVVQRGAKFLTVSQLASWAVEQIIERFPEPREKES